MILSFILVMYTCNEYQYGTGHFNESVINFEDVNTEYDDYNSTAPFIYYNYLFHFSSNRNSAGNDFDIVGENMYIDWSKANGTLKIGTNLFDDGRFGYLRPMFDSINTSCNELGPYSLVFNQIIGHSDLWTNLIMFANDCDGDYDIKFIYSESHYTNGVTTTEIKPIQKIDFLNSSANDLYPTFYGNGMYYPDEWAINKVSKIEKILFCSDREGTFDLYSVNVPSDSTLIKTLQSDSQFEIKKLAINSEQDDKCPFVNGNLLVFSSNRTGGFGGYDLYYSEYKDGNWTEPKNFGDKINTEYDEYRPIVLFIYEFDNNLMIFSSNRPGGKGGFDLYYVGIKQMIE